MAAGFVPGMYSHRHISLVIDRDATTSLVLVASLSHSTKRSRYLSVGIGVVASHSVFVGSGGWVENLGRAGYGQCPNRRASSKLGFSGVLGVGCCKPASQPGSCRLLRFCISDPVLYSTALSQDQLDLASDERAIVQMMWPTAQSGI